MKTCIDDIFTDSAEAIKSKIENLPMENVVVNFFDYVYSKDKAITKFEKTFIEKLNEGLSDFCYKLYKKHHIFSYIQKVDSDFDYMEIENIHYFDKYSKEQLLAVIKQYDSNLSEICTYGNYLYFDNFGCQELIDFFDHCIDTKDGIRYWNGMYKDIKEYMEDTLDSLIYKENEERNKVLVKNDLENYNYSIKSINEFVERIKELKSNLIENGAITESEINKSLSEIKEKL